MDGQSPGTAGRHHTGSAALQFWVQVPRSAAFLAAPAAEIQPQERKWMAFLKTGVFLAESRGLSFAMAVPSLGDADDAQIKEHHLRFPVPPP